MVLQDAKQQEENHPYNTSSGKPLSEIAHTMASQDLLREWRNKISHHREDDDAFKAQCCQTHEPKTRNSKVSDRGGVYI